MLDEILLFLLFFFFLYYAISFKRSEGYRIPSDEKYCQNLDFWLIVIVLVWPLWERRERWKRKKWKRVNIGGEMTGFRLYRKWKLLIWLTALQCFSREFPWPVSGWIISNYWTRLSKISWFVSGEQINYSPKSKAEANNWSARHWQITIFCDNRVQ